MSTEIIHNYDPHIFSIKVKRKKQRISRNQILKAIGCKHLSLDKIYTRGGNYFLFIYDTHPHLHGEDRPDFAEWADHPVLVQSLNHLTLNKWIQEGTKLVEEMEMNP